MGFSNIRNRYDKLISAENSKYEHPAMSLTDKKPIVVTFYNPNQLMSTANAGTQDVMSLVGPDSPVRYEKINSLITYGFKESVKQKSKDDKKGFTMDNVNVTHLPAGLFEPYEDALLKCNVDNEENIYRVTSVQQMMDVDKPMYRLEMDRFINKADPKYDYLEKQVVRNMKYIHEHFSTNNNPILDMDKYNDIVDILNVVDRLQVVYIRTFYNKNLNTFICDTGDYNYYSAFLTEFIMNSNCLYYRKMRTQMYLTHETLIDNKFLLEFKKSIYGKVLHNKFALVKEEDIFFTSGNWSSNDLNIFSFIFKTRLENVKVIRKDPDIISDYNTFPIEQMTPYVVDLRKKNVTDPDRMIDKVLNNLTTIENIKADLEEYDFECDDLEAFTILPIALYLLRKRYDEIAKKPVDENINKLIN